MMMDALQLFEQVGNTRAQGIAHNNLGNICAQLKEFNEAEIHLSQAVEEAEKHVLGFAEDTQHPATGSPKVGPSTQTTPSAASAVSPSGDFSIDMMADEDAEGKFMHELSLCNRRLNLCRVILDQVEAHLVAGHNMHSNPALRLDESLAEAKRLSDEMHEFVAKTFADGKFSSKMTTGRQLDFKLNQVREVVLGLRAMDARHGGQRCLPSDTAGLVERANTLLDEAQALASTENLLSIRSGQFTPVDPSKDQIVVHDGANQGRVPRELLIGKTLFARAQLAYSLAQDDIALTQLQTLLRGSGVFDGHLLSKCSTLMRKIYTAQDDLGRLDKLDKFDKALRKLQGLAGFKEVVFVVDVSGSMSGGRIKKAMENLVKIYNEHLEEDDKLALITFNSQVTQLLPLQERVQSVATYSMYAGKPQIKMQGRQMTIDTCYRTAFRDAIQTALTQWGAGVNRAHPQGGKRWIIALTDGDDNCSHISVEELRKLMSDAEVTMVCIGLEVGSQAKSECEQIVNATTNGMYIDARNTAALDDAFVKVAQLMAPSNMTMESM
jgi:uncharacterized protein YegL